MCFEYTCHPLEDCCIDILKIPPSTHPHNNPSPLYLQVSAIVTFNLQHVIQISEYVLLDAPHVQAVGHDRGDQFIPCLGVEVLGVRKSDTSKHCQSPHGVRKSMECWRVGAVIYRYSRLSDQVSR